MSAAPPSRSASAAEESLRRLAPFFPLGAPGRAPSSASAAAASPAGPRRKASSASSAGASSSRAGDSAERSSRATAVFAPSGRFESADPSSAPDPAERRPVASSAMGAQSGSSSDRRCPAAAQAASSAASAAGPVATCTALRRAPMNSAAYRRSAAALTSFCAPGGASSGSMEARKAPGGSTPSASGVPCTSISAAKESDGGASGPLERQSV